jgi:hypothetical protein
LPPEAEAGGAAVHHQHQQYRLGSKDLLRAEGPQAQWGD